MSHVASEASADSARDDLGPLLTAIRSLGIADMERLYLYGESRGARAVFQALRTDRFVRAAAITGFLPDLQELAGQRPEIRIVQRIPRGQTAATLSHARPRSERFGTPILLMFSEPAVGASYTQTLTLAHRRQMAGGFVFFDPFSKSDGPRLVSKAERDQLAIAWFR